MKKKLKSILIIFVTVFTLGANLQNKTSAVLFEVNVGVFNPDIAIPQVSAIPTLPAYLDPAPIFIANDNLNYMKYNPSHGGIPGALRKQCNSRKEAYEQAKHAGNGKEPVHHPNGHPKNKKPHFHPNVKGPKQHDHYFYPR